MKPSSEAEEARRPASDIRVFASSCTLHGLGHVFGPGRLTPRRGLWAVAVLLSLAAFLYQVEERVRYYGEFHHETALDEVESHQLTFPAVTLCNINPLRRSRLTPNDLHWAGPALLGLEPGEHAAFLRALGRPPAPPGFMPSPTFDTARLYARAGHALEDMLLDCRYRGRPCGPENFTAVSWPPDPSYQGSQSAGRSSPRTCHPQPCQPKLPQSQKTSTPMPEDPSPLLTRPQPHPYPSASLPSPGSCPWALSRSCSWTAVCDVPPPSMRHLPRLAAGPRAGLWGPCSWGRGDTSGLF